MELLPAIQMAKRTVCPAVAPKADRSDPNAVAKEVMKEETRRLMLQGQLRYLSDWDAMIFLCNPLLVANQNFTRTNMSSCAHIIYTKYCMDQEIPR